MSSHHLRATDQCAGAVGSDAAAVLRFVTVTPLSALASLGIIADAYGAIEQRVPCPQCGRGPRDDALGVNVESGVYHCFRCGWRGKAGVGDSHARPIIERIDSVYSVERRRALLRRIWSETTSLTDPRAQAVRRYFSARGLDKVLRDPPQILRAHPALSYWDGQHEIGRFPAMVALLTDRHGIAVTLHRTYLRHDGTAKAKVKSPKKLMSATTPRATRGGAIRLYPTDGVLGIAEGIESALSLKLICGIPTWSAYSADNMKVVRLPMVRELYIGVDVDESGIGESAARALAGRIARGGTPPRIVLVMPDGEQIPRDLNDDLVRRREGQPQCP